MSYIIDNLNERIDLAKTIVLKISELKRIPRNTQRDIHVISSPKVKYDPIKVNEIEKELSKWQFVTKELLINQFGENHRFVKCFDDSIASHRLGFDSRKELTLEIENGINALNSIIEIIPISEGESKDDTPKAPIVFISHSSKDLAFVEALVELLEGIGLDEKTLFCSSVPGYWINLGKDIYEVLLSMFTNRSLFVIFVQSHNFYNSPVSLNEMGAAWALKAEYCSILTPEMEYKEMTAVVDSRDVAIKVNEKEAPARLTEMKDAILHFLGKADISEVIWERKRNKFLKTVNPSYTLESSSSQSTAIEYQQLMIEKMKKENEDLRKASIKGNIFPASQKGCRHLRIFNAGKSTAKNIHIEWLNEDERIKFLTPLETIDDLTPQNKRDYHIVLYIGGPQIIRLRYTWDDDYRTGNTLEESLQL